jgi:hypothetical protein
MGFLREILAHNLRCVLAQKVPCTYTHRTIFPAPFTESSPSFCTRAYNQIERAYIRLLGQLSWG